MILLDTDVLIDVALDRDPHVEAAAELLTLLERRPRMAFVAWHTLSNFYYLVSPARGRDDARAFLVDLTRFVSVAPTDTEDFHFAAGLALGDFEDALQVAAARACGAKRGRITCLVTKNAAAAMTATTPRMVIKVFIGLSVSMRPHLRRDSTFAGTPRSAGSLPHRFRVPGFSYRSSDSRSCPESIRRIQSDRR